MKTFVFFIAFALTVYFINDKFSKAVRVIAFKEDEPKQGAIISFLIMILVIIAWTIFFSLF